MASNIRFIDNVKVGAYKTFGSGGSSGTGSLDIQNNGTGADLMLIKNTSDQGIKVTGTGVLQLIEFGSLPSAIEGGVVYHSDNVYVGL